MSESVRSMVQGKLLLLISLLVLSGALSAEGCTKQRRSNRYLIPEGYVGWVKVVFNVKDAPELPVEDGHYLFNFPTSGILKTSSRIEYGAASDEFYYYDANNGRKRLESSDIGSMIWGLYNGSSGTASMNQSSKDVPEDKKDLYLGFFIGTEEMYMKYGGQKEDEPGPIDTRANPSKESQ